MRRTAQRRNMAGGEQELARLKQARVFFCDGPGSGFPLIKGMQASGLRIVARLDVRFLGIGLLLGLISCDPVRSEVGAVLDTGGGSTSKGGGNSVSAAGSTGAAGTPSTAGGVTAAAPAGSPIYTRAERLTNSQFAHAAIDILGLPAETDLQSDFEPAVLGTTDFSNNEYLLVADARAVTAFEVAAEKAASLATGSAEALARLYTGTDADGFVRQLGRRAFRRPISDDEAERYTAIFARGEELYGAGFANGAALVIRAMLQSPSFLYRTELGPVGEPLSDYEIASKLSFWLLDTTPSDALLADAAAGKLGDADYLVSVAGAMLEQPAATEVMRTFHRELYQVDLLDDVVKDNALVPYWTSAVNAEAKAASLSFFDHIFDEGLGLRDILTSTRGFVGPLLAPLYGQSAPAKLEERELGSARRGYFTQVPLLMRDGHNADPYTIQRAVRLALNVLCLPLPAPPPTIGPLPEQQPNQTNRQKLEMETATCGGECHQTMNPLGLAFEGFDGMGVARDFDRGQPVDASGSFAFSSGVSSFADAAELMTKLADDDLPYACYGRKLASYGLQRNIVEDDQDLITTLADASRAGSTKDAVLALVGDPSFRLREKDSP